jgi:hypothetical protein
MKKAGIAVILIGLAMTIFTAFTFFTREKVANIGDVKITRDKPHNLKWSPLIGIAVMIGGGVMVLLPTKK